jgi:hypothetical protein
VFNVPGLSMDYFIPPADIYDASPWLTGINYNYVFDLIAILVGFVVYLIFKCSM